MKAAIKQMMEDDIELCVAAYAGNGQDSYSLYQFMIARYNSFFKGFGEEIPCEEKDQIDIAQADYRPELNAVMGKLQALLIADNMAEPQYHGLDLFQEMIDEDIECLQQAVSDRSNSVSPQCAKSQLYQDVTAKYHPYIPKLSDGLWGIIPGPSIYSIPTDNDRLFYNLNQLLQKLKAFKATGYPTLIPIKEIHTTPIVNISNTNQNSMSINITFDEARKQVEGMSALPEAQIEEILSKIDILQEIVNSKERKSRKWEQAKDTVRWIADRGIDVAITLLPLLLKIAE